MTRVAEGRIDCGFRLHPCRDWDLAAADLLVHEAGGVMTNLAGELLVYNLHDPVHGAVLAAGRDQTRSDARSGAQPPQAIRLTIRKSIMSDQAPPKQLLHLVLGGELTRSRRHQVQGSRCKVDIVGVYPNYATAYAAWKAKAQQTVDNAQMRYFIVHLHRLLDPELPNPAAR